MFGDDYLSYSSQLASSLYYSSASLPLYNFYEWIIAQLAACVKYILKKAVEDSYALRASKALRTILIQWSPIRSKFDKISAYTEEATAPVHSFLTILWKWF